MRCWKKTMIGLFALGILAGLWVPGTWAEPSPEAQKIIAAHHQAAADAQKRAAFHGEMEKTFVGGRGGSKIDMVSHCRYWADYYRKLAAQEEQAATEFGQKGF